MTITIRHDPASPGELGNARFTSPARFVSITAERESAQPIGLYLAAGGLRVSVDFTDEEAKALVACLKHALALRRGAEQQEAA